MSKISNLNAEAKNNRVRYQEAEKKLKDFEGIEDPQAALKAMETVKNLDDSKLVDAGKMQKLKEEMSETARQREEALTKQFQEKEQEYLETIGGKDTQIFDLMVTKQFATSDTILNKTNLTPDIAAVYFGKNFKIEKDGQGDLVVVGYLNGDRIPSKKRFGEPADFEEAIGVILDNYSMKDRIMRPGKGGGPDAAGNQGQSPGSGTVRRGDNNAFIENLDKIANGEVTVEMTG